MGLEDVGVRLVAQDEASFKAALEHAQQSIDKLDKSIDDLAKTNQKTKTATDPLAKSLEELGKKVVAMFAVEKVVDFFRSTIAAASDMNETLSKSQVVFGDSAAAVEEMGNTAARAMGISKQEAIAAAATYGNLFTSMGMGKKVSAEMSIGLVQLASDLASFNNIPVDVALEKLRAGLVGESEPLKSLGINLNEAALKEEALRLGLIESGQQLGASEKAQAAYSLMLQQSTSAQGDFARTADGAANQQRILEAQTKDLTVSIGKGLLPAWLELLKAGNDLLGTLDKLIQMQSGYTGILQDHNSKVLKTAKSYGEYRTEMERATKAAGWQAEADGRVYKVIVDSLGPRKVYNEQIRISSEEEWKSVQANEALAAASQKTGAIADESGYLVEDAAKRQYDAYSQLAKIMAGETVQAAKDLADAQSVIKARMSEVALFMAGSVGKENEKYISDLRAAKEALETTQSKMRELLNIKGPWTPEQQAAYSSLLAAQDTEKAKIKEIETAHDKAMKTILANMLLTKLSYDGLTQEESDFYIKTVSDWGLIDQATVDAWNEVDTYIARLNGAESAAGAVATAVNKIPANKTVTITINEKTKKYLEEGEPTSNPAPAEPGWGTGGSGGASIMGPSMMAGSVAAPVTNNYSWNTAYNLSVITSQSQAVIERSFAIMRMLAG